MCPNKRTWLNDIEVICSSLFSRVDPNFYLVIATNIAMENGPFIDGLLIKHCGFLYLKLPAGIWSPGFACPSTYSPLYFRRSDSCSGKMQGSQAHSTCSTCHFGTLRAQMPMPIANKIWWDLMGFVGLWVWYTSSIMFNLFHGIQEFVFWYDLLWHLIRSINV